MKTVQRSEFCGKDARGEEVRLESIWGGDVFRGSIDVNGAARSGIWCKMHPSGAAMISAKSGDRLYCVPESGDLVVSGYEKLDATLVIED